MFEGKVSVEGSEVVVPVVHDNAEILLRKWVVFIGTQASDRGRLQRRLEQLMRFLGEASLYRLGTKAQIHIRGIAVKTYRGEELVIVRGSENRRWREIPYLEAPDAGKVGEAMVEVHWDDGIRAEWWVLGEVFNRLKVVANDRVGLPSWLLWNLQLGDRSLPLLFGTSGGLAVANAVFRKEEVEALVGSSLATELQRQLGEWTCSFRLDAPKEKSYGCEVVAEIRRRGPKGDIADGFPVEFRVPMGCYTEGDLELRAKTVLSLYARALAELATIKEVLGHYGFRGCLTGGTLVIFGSGDKALGLVHWEDLKVVLSTPRAVEAKDREAVMATGSLSIKWKTQFFNPTFVEFLCSCCCAGNLGIYASEAAQFLPRLLSFYALLLCIAVAIRPLQ